MTHKEQILNKIEQLKPQFQAVDARHKKQSSEQIYNEYFFSEKIGKKLYIRNYLEKYYSLPEELKRFLKSIDINQD